MPINLTSASDTFSATGYMRPTLAGATSSFLGTNEDPSDVDGQMQVTLDGATSRFLSRIDGYPRMGTYRIGNRSWGDNPTNTGTNFDRDEDEMFAMVNCHFNIIGPQASRGSGFQAALLDWLSYVDNESVNPDCITYCYTDPQETGLTGSNANKLSGEVGPNGVLDWWLYRDTSANPPVQSTTFPGSYHTNMTDQVTPDAQGKIWPEWYADESDLIQATFDFVNTDPTPRIHLYNDVQDHRHRSNAQDHNANGTEDDGRSDWNTLGTEGFTQAEKNRQGHNIYINRMKSRFPGMLTSANMVTWGQENDSENIRDMFTGNNSNPGGVHSFYEQLNDGGVIEGQSKQFSFPYSGIVDAEDGSGITINAFGSFRMAFNAYLYGMIAAANPKHICNQWIVYMQSGGNWQNPTVGDNIRADSMALARWGWGMTMLDDGYFYVSPADPEYGYTIHLDEEGIYNTATTGLSREYMTAAVDPPARTTEWDTQASSRLAGSSDDNALFGRRFQGPAGEYVVLVNSNNDYTTSRTIVVTSGADFSAGEIESGQYRFLDGVQDSSHNPGGGAITSNFSLSGMNAQLLIPA